MTLALSKRWLIKHADPLLQVKLSNGLNIHPTVSQLLINRDIETVEDARFFLKGDLKDLHDPFLLKDMDKAIERIKQAQRNNETVLIFGDYDVDGVASSAILHNALKQFGVKVINYIPHRFSEGYGLNETIGFFAKEQGVSLLIAVDCGITAHTEVDILNGLGIDVIILDHHEPTQGKLPQAYAVVNPKRSDCPYPFKYLASVGLSAKLVYALLGKSVIDDLELVAIGTIADVVPLRGENRIFVQQGLPLINQTKNVGLAALLDVARIKDKPILPHYVGFIIGPRINATGRMDSAQKSLELLLSKNSSEAYALANFLEQLNTKRQRTQNSIIEEALNIVERDINFKDHKVIVLSKAGWHKGVLGIVAARITETFYRPTVVISLMDGIGTASARSITGFHLFEALTHCSSLLENFGGHKGAAGLTIKEENIEHFRNRLNDFAVSVFKEDSLVPTLEIECEVPLSQVTMDFVKTIEAMEPFGEGNPAPIFCTRQVTVKSPPSLLGKDTLKFWVSDGETVLPAVGFRMGKYRGMIELGKKIDIAYQVGIDDWNKAPTIQLKLKDIKAA